MLQEEGAIYDISRRGYSQFFFWCSGLGLQIGFPCQLKLVFRQNPVPSLPHWKDRTHTFFRRYSYPDVTVKNTIRIKSQDSVLQESVRWSSRSDCFHVSHSEHLRSRVRWFSVFFFLTLNVIKVLWPESYRKTKESDQYRLERSRKRTREGSRSGEVWWERMKWESGMNGHVDKSRGIGILNVSLPNLYLRSNRRIPWLTVS
jgi:hypothetical protein